MSLEEAIAAQTAAIKEQTAVLTKLVTAIAVNVAGGAKLAAAAVEKTAEPTGEATTAGPEKKLTRRQRESRTEIPTVDEDNLPPPVAERVLPEGERNEAYYKEHVQPTLLKLAGLDKAVLIDMFAKFGVKSGKELAPETWDAAFVTAKALIEQVIERDERLKKEKEEADLA